MMIVTDGGCDDDSDRWWRLFFCETMPSHLNDNSYKPTTGRGFSGTSKN